MLTTVITILVVVVIFIILFKVFKWLMRIMLVVVFIAIAWITNPSWLDHVNAIEKKYPDVTAASKHGHFDNYHIFGLTTWNDKVIGVGAFTQVVIFRSPN